MKQTFMAAGGFLENLFPVTFNITEKKEGKKNPSVCDIEFYRATEFQTELTN